MPRRIVVTFDMVTPESAEHGDVSDSGFIDESGIPIEPDDLDIEEFGDESTAAAHLAAKEIGNCVEPSSSRFHSGIWYTDADSDIDYRTGAETRKSYHLKGFTTAEEELIHSLITGKAAR